ncbi:MAG: hypothetical protein ACRDQW_16100 [Haloechinothrix sp.]
MDPNIEQAGHELLLRLAGRLPDPLLWRYRDWLGEGAVSTLARTLPKSLLKHNIDLDQHEHGLLVDGFVPHGADRHQVSSTLGVDAGAQTRYTFTQASPESVNAADQVDAVIGATLRGRPNVGEVRQSWRQAGDGEAKRVLLITALDDCARLTGEVQRVLRVLGEEDPGVEVMPPRLDLRDYHQVALANSTSLCVGAAGGRRRTAVG